MSVCSSIIYNRPKVEKPKCQFTDEWINQMWHIHTKECYLAIIREWSSGAWYNVWMNVEMNLENIMLRERGQTQKAPYKVWFHLHEMSKIGKSIAIKSVIRARGMGE